MVRLARSAFMMMLLWVSMPVSAATFSYVGPPENPNSVDIYDPDRMHRFRLEGVVELGDADRFQDFVSSVFGGGGSIPYRQLLLELNSPGGSLEAGLELVEAVHGRFVTYVGPGDSCVSACALIFMAGSVTEGDGYVELFRVLHPLGILGFHAPYAFSEEGADLVDPAIRDALLPDAERGARLAASRLVALQRDGILPSSLVEELLLVGDADLLIVDKVDLAGRWDIQLADRIAFTPQDGVVTSADRAALGVYCVNVESWLTDSSAIVEWEKPPLGPDLWSDGMSTSCRITPQQDGYLAVISTDALSYTGTVFEWQTNPAETPLATLATPTSVGAGPFDGPTPPARFEGTCENGTQWVGGWRGPTWRDSVAFAELRRCGAPDDIDNALYSLSCHHGTGQIETRVNLDAIAAPSSFRGTFQVDDGYELSIPQTVVIDRGPRETISRLDRNYFTFASLKQGRQLILRLDGQVHFYHLLGSRGAIEAMEAACM